MERQIRTVRIVGMGALGMLFGYRIQEAVGKDSFSFVMDPARFLKYQGKTFTINGKPYDFSLSSSEGAGPADLVIVAVKFPGLSGAMETIEKLVGPDTVLVSLLNGITSEEILGCRFGHDRVMISVAQAMDAMHFGNALSFTKTGEILIGVPEDAATVRRERLDAVTAFFDRAGVPYRKEKDIIRRLWGKFLLNVGINQVCMVYGIGYGKALEKNSQARMTLIGAMREVVLVANREGISLSERDVEEYLAIIAGLDPSSTPSMGQDRINRKPSEVDLFAGEVVRLGKKHGIEVPANEYLLQRVREIEADY